MFIDVHISPNISTNPILTQDKCTDGVSPPSLEWNAVLHMDESTEVGFSAEKWKFGRQDAVSLTGRGPPALQSSKSANHAQWRRRVGVNVWVENLPCLHPRSHNAASTLT